MGRDDDEPRGAGKGSEAGRNAGDAAAQAGSSPRATAGKGALDAQIEDREGVSLDFVTVACAGECFEVVAVAHGGYPPYTFLWEDGSTSAVRTLCPESTGVFSVEVSDRGYQSDEFSRASETVEAEVTAEVLQCPVTTDAGAAPPDGGAPDGGNDRPFMWKALCAEDSSFEGQNLGSIPGFPWRTCIDPGASGIEISGPAAAFGRPEAYEGNQYLRLQLPPGASIVISQQLCETVRAGMGYFWSEADLLGLGSGPARLEIFLSQGACQTDTVSLLDWQPQTAWSSACGAWPATADADHVVLRASAIGNAPAIIYLDRLFPRVPSCMMP